MLKVAGLGLARPTDRREADEFESTTIQISKTFPCVQTDVFLTSTLPSTYEVAEKSATHIFPN